MKKIFISILIVVLLLTITLQPTKKAKAFDEPVNDSEYTVNLVDYQNGFDNKDSNYPILRLFIADLYFTYEVGFLREQYNEFPVGSVYIMIKELYIELQGSKYTDIDGFIQPTSIVLTAQYSIPRLDDGTSNLELYNSSNRIYTKLQYEDIINGTYGLDKIDLANFKPKLQLGFYSTNYENGINVIPYAKFLYQNQSINFRVKQSALNDDEFYLGSPNPEENRLLNYDIYFNDIDYPHLDTYYNNSLLKTYIDDNNLVPNVDLPGYDNVMTTIFDGFTSIMNVEVFPNITIGLILGIPLLLGALLIILKFIRG